VTKRLREGAFAFIEDDLLNGNDLKQSFHVIRAANILNLHCFPESVLRRMISNLKERLSDNGLLIVCRTKADRSNHGTIFQLRGGSISALAKIGEGSEVEHLITAAFSR
jgi:methylase of polypeptide subunit release factors